MSTPTKRPRTDSRVDKFGERRRELARSALTTLAERGYAHTSLRDIANNSDFTHGVLHYYFADKNELIIFGVREYKAQCVTRYDDAVEGAVSGDDLCRRFSGAMATSLADEATLHRLWYDMRAQSYFDEGFRPAVGEIETGLEAMIWRVIKRCCEFTGRPPVLTPPVAYALFDGLFQQALFRWFDNDPKAADTLAEQVFAVLTAIARIG
jgi:AcrR family transcriptional regulator